MIQQLKSANLNFTSSPSKTMSPCLVEYTKKMKTQEDSVQLQNNTVNKIEQKNPKKGFIQKLKDIRNGAVHVVKGYNTTTSVAKGAIKGIVGGIIAGGITGIVGKSLAEGKNTVTETLKALAKNTWSAVKTVGKSAWNVIAESPINNVKKLVSAIPNFYKNYLTNEGKHYTKTAIAATVIGLGVVAYQIISAKWNANKKNSEIDHTVGEGHNKF